MSGIVLPVNEEKIYYDERKKRFVFLNGASHQKAREFNRIHFNTSRPDFIGA